MNYRKIKAEHLEKMAYVYIRQSTSHQVQHHRESRRRQYALKEEARKMGFRGVLVLDQDLAISGSGFKDRPGFEKLVQDVSLGLVGVIFCTEMSRLARNNSDWARLFEVCGVLNTLIVDGDGVYDLANPNDRLVLGLKGTMSEVELRVMKNRLANGAKLKAERGELLHRPPIGYARLGKNRIRKDPDERIRETVATLFRKFDELQNGWRLYKWFQEKEVPFPKKQYFEGECETVWEPVTYPAIVSILKNPTYAGVYAYGRTKTVVRVEDRALVKKKLYKTDPKAWDVFLKDHHEGYISWETYERNKGALLSNMKVLDSKGPAQSGPALLQGLLRCKRCGIKLRVRYRGKNGRIAAFECREKKGRVNKPGCFTFSAAKLEGAIVVQALKVVEPFGVEAGLEAIEENNRKIKERKELMVLELHQVKYEAKRAQREYKRTDPENRNVIAFLAKEWDQALQAVSDTELKIEELDRNLRPLTEADKKALDALTRDLPRLWKKASTTTVMKKRILRSVIEQVWIDIDQERSLVKAEIEWKGGAYTKTEVKKKKRGEKANQTSQETIGVVGQLAKWLPDKKIIVVLNRIGLKTGAGNTWTTERLRALRNGQGIPKYDRRKPQEYVSLEEAAKKLDLPVRQMRELIDRGLIKGEQIMANAPWAVEVADLESEKTQKLAKKLKESRLEAPWTEFQESLFVEPQRL